MEHVLIWEGDQQAAVLMEAAMKEVMWKIYGEKGVSGYSKALGKSGQQRIEMRSTGAPANPTVMQEAMLPGTSWPLSGSGWMSDSEAKDSGL